jgi:hypothetical protein
MSPLSFKETFAVHTGVCTAIINLFDRLYRISITNLMYDKDNMIMLIAFNGLCMHLGASITR